jgi:regulator of protease activity HflC (stomatin/prohibitin superfamily)
MLQEKVAKSWSGWVMVGVLLAVLAGSIVMLASSSDVQETAGLIAAVVAVLALDGLGWFGFTVVTPNTARVVLLFGKYLGSIKTPGFWWVNPLTTRRMVSLKVRNFESGKLKVNDHIGNPIEIAAIVVWRVVETAEAVFQVDDYEHFVHVQTESAVRNLATSFPYDAHEEGELSLRGSTSEVSQRLRQEIQDRLATAGVEVIEARISHLAYAPEIANAMLRRQQATAVIAARQKIVEGAVGMVEMALELLSSKHVVELDEERKASMVSNLLVILCSDRDAQPVVNAGTLYQ